MKSIVVFVFFLISIINCQSLLGDGDVLELYHNYSLTSKYSTYFNYYFYPHLELGNVISFKIVYTYYYLCSSFNIYNGNTRIDSIPNCCYGYYRHYDLTVSEPFPSILRIEINSSSYNDKIPYYLYIYNKGYKIPLNFPNIILNNIIYKDLEIPYEITDLSENRKLILEARIEYPQYGDIVQVNINQNTYEFNETSSTEILLEKDYTYSIKIIPKYQSIESWFTYLLIYFDEERDFNTLFYQNNSLTFTTILTNNFWYIIDTVNSIDDINEYTLALNQGFVSNEELKYNIKVKRYSTNDISYIKDNVPISDDEYEEIYEPIIEQSLTFKACEKSCLNVNTILIAIELNYNHANSILYKYTINKTLNYKELEFKSYDIKWYTYYDFKPLYVRSKDTVFISTNHSKTISHYNSNNYKIFNSFYNGRLYISYPNNDSNRNQVKILYSDKLAKMENDVDVGNLEIYRFNSLEMTFGEINLDDSIESKFYIFELMKNQDKYFYIKSLKSINYYIFYEGIEGYSFFTIESMPVSIMKFGQSQIINDITLMSYKNEYLVKIGNTASSYSLLNLYIIKYENSKTISLEEGKPKIFNFPKNEDNINIEINLINDDISYIYLKIASKNINGNLYINYSDKKYILNNESIIIDNIDKKSKITLNIKNEDNIEEEIPILIKSVIPSNKVITLSNYNKYQFNQDKYGIIKFKDDKTVNMKFRTNLSEIEFSYYYCYLSEDITKQIFDIINPEFFNQSRINNEEYNFELSTKVELERTFNSETKYLYLIFCFKQNVEVSTGDVDILYNKFNVSYRTIYSKNKWYIIDSINSIDNNNSYILEIKEGYQYDESKEFYVYIKTYETNDINYIKNNIPLSGDGYNYYQYLYLNKKMEFTICNKNDCSKSKAILILIDINYSTSISYYNKYEFKRNLYNQTIEFKSYDIKWYTNYYFNGIQVKNKDTIFISTNHSNTIFPIQKEKYKLFESFYDGYLLVSLPTNEEEDYRNVFNFTYSDEKIKMKNKDDIGHIEVFKFDSENMSFEKLILDNTFQTKIYNFELIKSNGKYYYITIDGNEKYYIFYDGDKDNSIFKINTMPVDIIQFSNSEINDVIILISNKNEYLLKIDVSKFKYNLLNMFIIKSENSTSLDLEEGKIKMITYYPTENDLLLEINILDQQISEQAYINLIIPSKKINGNLYITYNDNIYLLNNTGVNIIYQQQNNIILHIKDNDSINEEIPIMIKLGLLPEQFKNISNISEKYVFNQGQYGIIKYNNNKMIKIKFKMDFEGITFGYYNCYLSDDFTNNTSNIIHPELFNHIKYDIKDDIFEMKTELDIARNNTLKKENLYLILSFNGKTEVSLLDFYSFYGKSLLFLETMIQNNTIYIVDTINSIDNYNQYKLIINEGYQNNEEQIFSIRVKYYYTNDIELIKVSMPGLNEAYDEEKNFIYNEALTFSVCEKNSCLNKKAILLEIKLLYNNKNSVLYKYSIRKIIENKPLEFKEYNINWYTDYDFSPINVLNNDTIIISTNHSNTIFPDNDNNYKKFESFYNGMIFISFPDKDPNKNQIKIRYSDSNTIEQNVEDIGHMEILKLNSEEASLDMINIDQLELPKLYKFELKNNKEKYFYIKNNRKDSYYIFSESEDGIIFKTYFIIEQLPIDIITFSEKYYGEHIKLMTYNNEYLINLKNTDYNYGLINMYIIKNEDSNIIDLSEEGQLKIVTLLFNEKEKLIQINFLTETVTNETYVNLRIPQIFLENELIVNYLNKEYVLNNTGVNIYNIEKKNTITFNIIDKRQKNKDIPILIKFGIQPNNIKYLSNNNTNEYKYEFNPGKFGIIRYLQNKTINMKLKPNKTNTIMNYYTCYLAEDVNINISNIVDPKYFNSTVLTSEEYYFEIKTSLSTYKDKSYIYYNIKSKIEYLYLIFTFDEKTEVIFGEQHTPTGEETDNISPSPSSSPDSSDTSDSIDNKLVIIIISVCVTLIIIVLIIACFCRKRRNSNSMNFNSLLNDIGKQNNIPSIELSQGK